jgi:hypothetical protein
VIGQWRVLALQGHPGCDHLLAKAGFELVRFYFSLVQSPQIFPEEGQRDVFQAL